jgi:hypothetical protein
MCVGALRSVVVVAVAVRIRVALLVRFSARSAWLDSPSVGMLERSCRYSTVACD